jgi:uncharacterized protein YbaR (Trm112 family)
VPCLRRQSLRVRNAWAAARQRVKWRPAPHLETDMPVDGKLLEILCCPVSKTPLQRLPAARLQKLNAAIDRGEVKFVDGKAVETALEEALVTVDMKVIYPVDDGIPILLHEQGIGTTQLQDF